MSKQPRDPKTPRGRGEASDEHVARLEKALADALARNESTESMLSDQQQRLKALGGGREETMRALAEARDELRRVSQERDELRKQLKRVDSVQTATIALPEGDPSPSMIGGELPSLDDLMAALGDIETPRGGPDGILHQRVQGEHAGDGSEEMISPALVFPEEFAATAKPAANAGAASGATAEPAADPMPVSRLLVLLDPERPIKYPLFKEVMTIGRADIADIQISNGYLSRVHARLVTTAKGVFIEDAESKNGIRVNAKLTDHQPLQHGDVIDLGRLRFRFIDTAVDEAE